MTEEISMIKEIDKRVDTEKTDQIETEIEIKQREIETNVVTEKRIVVQATNKSLVETIKIKTARRNTREVRARAEAQERSLPTTMTPAIFGSRRTRRTEATVDHQRRATGTDRKSVV